MSPDFAFTVLFSITAAAAFTVLIVALQGPRTRPTRAWAWWIAVAIVVAGTLLNLTATLSPVLFGETFLPWTIPASIALLCSTLLVFWRPRWAAWLLTVTAVAVPTLVSVVTLLAGQADQFRDLAGAVVMFYSVRSLLAAALLAVATVPARGSRLPEVPSPKRQSESALTG